MKYCINALLKNNNEIMQYYMIDNDIALIMHYRALLQVPERNQSARVIFTKPLQTLCGLFTLHTN